MEATKNIFEKEQKVNTILQDNSKRLTTQFAHYNKEENWVIVRHNGDEMAMSMENWLKMIELVGDVYEDAYPDDKAARFIKMAGNVVASAIFLGLWIGGAYLVLAFLYADINYKEWEMSDFLKRLLLILGLWFGISTIRRTNKNKSDVGK